MAGSTALGSGAQLQTLQLPLTSGTTLNKLLKLSVLRFPHHSNGLIINIL